ncbi:MAG: hypothetical protein IJ880_03845 [Bacilli bacterium]|nr:hypothetical protein [Bacilli bacterium]MBR3119820.1 hypothetical protein [Oceanobacillus sp.]
MGYVISLIVFTILGGVYGFSYEIIKWRANSEPIKGGLTGAMAAFFIGTVGIIVINVGVLYIADSEDYLVETEGIYSLKDNAVSEGMFFLGSGMIDGDLKYYYIVEEEKGLIIKNVGKDFTYLKETNDEEPNLKVYQKGLKNEWLQEWFPMMFSNKTYVMTVPKGSIIYDFNIDME